MKWTYIWLGSIILFIVSFIVMILVKVIPGIDLPNACWWIPAVSAILFFVSLKKSQKEIAVAFRNVFQDFLECGKTFSRADTYNYPSSYVREIDRVSDELTDAGMIAAGDFCSPPDEVAGFGRKNFSRILHSPDGTVWAEVKRMRPNFLVRWGLTILGGGCNFRTVTDISIYFEHGNVLIVSNVKIPILRPIPGIQKEGLPGQSPRELLQSAMEWKRKIENNGVNPAEHLDLEAFQKAMYSAEIYFNFKNSGQEFPSNETLKKEGFSDAAIEKYRKICTAFPPHEKVGTEAEIPEPVPAESVPLPPVSAAPEATTSEWEAARNRYVRSVTNFAVAVLLSAVNVILISTDSDITFPFSAFFPSLMVILGKNAVEAGSPEIVASFCLSFAIAFVVLLALCWLLARKYRCFILISFLLFVFDTILLIPLIPEGGSGIWIEVVFHVWVLWTLFSGIKAWRELKRLQAFRPKETAGRDGKGVKGCLLGCVGLIGIGVILVVVLVGIVFTSLAHSAKFTDVLLSAGERAELTQAFARLDRVLTAKAPGLQAKRKPLEPSMRIRLGNATQTKTVEALNMWYEFVSGMEDCELIPGCNVAGIDFAVDLREKCDTPLIRMVSPDRAASLILLHDDAGDGFFLGLTPGNTGVYHDVLETPGTDDYVGSLTHFVNLIAESIEQEVWTYDKSGKLICREATFEQFQKKFFPQIRSPEGGGK